MKQQQNQEQENKKNIINNIFKNKDIIIVLMLICLLIIVYILFMQVAKEDISVSSERPTGFIYFSEIMTNNESYPDMRGEICDWAELYNSSGNDIDVSGYIIYDGQKEQKLVLPQGTVIGAKDYLLISFESGDGNLTAPFALSKNGGETLILSNNLDNIIDNVIIPELKKDHTMVRTNTGTWKISSQPTPLFENDSDKYLEYINILSQQTSPIQITEVVSSNLGSGNDGYSLYDWVEIANVSQENINLSEYFISDDSEQKYKAKLPQKILAPGEYIVIFAAGKDSDDLEGNYIDLKISAEGETLYLFNWRGNTCQTLNVPQMPKNYAYALLNDEFVITPKKTPGSANNQNDSDISYFNGIVISEVCPANQSGIMDANGDFSDWIEIQNTSQSDINLGSLWLSKDSQNVFGFNLPEITLSSGQYLVLFCDQRQSSDNDIHSGFPLSSWSESITLYTQDGYLIDIFAYENALDDMTYIKSDDSAVIQSDYITPGYSNDINGLVAYKQSCKNDSPIQINEVMTSNSTVLPQSFGENYDWVEIKNNSNQEINLSGYSLTDDLSSSDKFVFPNVNLSPDEMIVIVLSGDVNKSTKDYYHANFSLSAEYSALYLVNENVPVDWVTLYNIPPDTSYGRVQNKNGFYHFEYPTPGTQNIGGADSVTKAPVPSYEGGTYQIGNEGMSIELLGDGDIYYTLDGSWPDLNSQMYTQPIEIKDTTVIRAIAKYENMLVSNTISTSYFLNTDHQLPILSLSVNYDDMFNRYTGIYVKGDSQIGNYYKDWEKYANLTFYDNDGPGFSVDCGLKMHGGGSRRSDEKKSLKVIFRPKYSQSTISYDLFGDDSPNEFSSLVIRAGEDYRYTVFRSELVTGLAKDADPNALTQDHKYCVLYVNGEYFGIFALMERYNEEYYAARYNVSPESVEIVGTYDLEDSDFYDLIEYCRSHNMSEQQNYDYIASRVDIDILIDWCIFQCYSGNTDITYNVRVIRSTEGDGKWRYCLYDLDWTFRSPEPTFNTVFGRRGSIFSLPNYLLENEEFRSQLLSRIDELRDTVLSDENVLNKIDEYDTLLKSELPADRQKWSVAMHLYDTRLEILKSMVRDADRWGSLMSSLNLILSEY